MDKYQITLKTYNDLALAYQNKFMDLDIYQASYDLFCRYVEKGQPRILEIGCGPGNITRYILSKRPDFRIEAIDLAPNMIELARQNNPTADFKVLDARDIDQLDGPFDAILCGFCLPYLSKADCNKLIADCAGLLRPDGIFYCSTMEGEEEQSGYESSSDGQHQAYVHYHRADYLQARLQEQHFELLDVHRQDYPKPDGSITVDMFFIARLTPHQEY